MNTHSYVVHYVARLIDYGKGCPDPELDDFTLGQIADQIIGAVAAPDSRSEVRTRTLGHAFDAGYSGMSSACNHLVLRDGYGGACGLPREHPVHAAGTEKGDDDG